MGSPKSYLVSKPKSSNDPLTPKGSCSYPSVGSSNEPSHGSIAVAVSPRIGKISTATHSRSKNLPPSASCCESFVTLKQVSKRTLNTVGIKLVVLAEELKRVDLADELEPDAAHLARVITGAVHELLDGHLRQRRRLRRRQLVDRRHRISA